MPVVCLGPVCIPIWGLLPVALLFLQKVWNWINGRGFVDGSTKVNVKPVLRREPVYVGSSQAGEVAAEISSQPLNCSRMSSKYLNQRFIWQNLC